jgi:uncharacterized membrane protein YdcZ (DUF606 family)
MYIDGPDSRTKLQKRLDSILLCVFVSTIVGLTLLTVLLGIVSSKPDVCTTPTESITATDH